MSVIAAPTVYGIETLLAFSHFPVLQ